jgi:hypothetical protein
MKTYAIALLLASVSAACEDDNTKKNDLILQAMTTQHNTAVALKTATVTQYETDLKTEVDNVADKKVLLAAAEKAG